MRPSPQQLSSVPLFAALDAEDRARIADWFEVERVSAGTHLAGEGAAGYSFFILLDGEAMVTSDGDEVRSLGEMALLGDGRRKGTVTIASDATVLVLYGTEFRRLQQELPQVAAVIARAMRERLGATS